jgi:hypothetical protein
MSAAAGASLAEESKAIYRICSKWDTATDEERRTAKAFVGRFIRYPFKMACVPSDSDDEEECPVPFVEIYVQSASRGKVTDWLEIQETGAMGVIFDEYSDPERPEVLRVSDACDEFNDAAGVEFVEHADSDEEEEAKVGGATAEDSESE